MSLVLVIVLLTLTGSSYGQFSGLAVTDDGAEVYFSTGLRLKAEEQLRLPQTGAIYRIVEGRVERFTEPPPLDRTFPKSHINPQASGDGTVVSYTQQTVCAYGYSSCETSFPRATYYSTLLVRGRRFGETLGGKAQISQNGRFVVNAGYWATLAFRSQYHEMRDLQTGQKFNLAVWPSNEQQAVTNDGRVLGFDLPQGGSLILWSREARIPRSRQPLRKLRTTEPARTAILDERATWVIYETKVGANLRALEVDTGRDIFLARAAQQGFQPSISRDGTLVLYVAEPGPDRPPQAFLVRPDGTGYRQLTNFPDGVSEAVLSGLGENVIAVTPTGRLTRVNTATGAVQEVIAATPTYFLSGGLVAGSRTLLEGKGLPAPTLVAPTPLPRQLGGMRVLVDGEPMPLLSVGPQGIWFQVPFEMQDPGRAMRVELENSSVFDGALQVRIGRRSPRFFTDNGQIGQPLLLAHQDFRAAVTSENPARPGEIVHAYATGLGPVTPEAVTGVPAPLDKLFRLTDPFDCQTGSRPMEVLFAGLAPGMIGVYQVSIRLPDSLPVRTLYLNCGFSPERYAGFIPTPYPPR